MSHARSMGWMLCALLVVAPAAWGEEEAAAEDLDVPQYDAEADIAADAFAAEQKLVLVQYVECLQASQGAAHSRFDEAAYESCLSQREAYAALLPRGMETDVLDAIDSRVASEWGAR